MQLFLENAQYKSQMTWSAKFLGAPLNHEIAERVQNYSFDTSLSAAPY